MTEIEAAKNNSSNRRPKNRSVKDINVEGRTVDGTSLFFSTDVVSSTSTGSSSSAVPKSFICCCSGQDSCMLTPRCMLPSLRSAPHPAICPCEPRRPVDDMQAVSCGARSIQYSRLLPASSSQPRSIVGRAGSGPMGRVHI